MMVIPPLSRTNRAILIVLGAFFVLQTALSGLAHISLLGLLGLTPRLAFDGHVYQLLTYPFVQSGFMSGLFNGMIIWFIGADLEAKWGTKTYLTLMAVSVIGGGLFFLLSSYAFLSSTSLWMTPLVGIDGVCFSLLLAYSIVFSDRVLAFMMIFPMKAKYFCWLLIGVELFLAFSPGQGMSSWGHLGSMGVAYLYLKWKSRSFQKRLDSRRRHLSIVQSEKKSARHDDPRYFQ